MNKSLLITIIALMLTTDIVMIGCQTSTQKEKIANDKVEQAKKDLDSAKANATKVANAEEWKTFKQESELKIQANKIRIEELKLKMKKSGKTMDAVYEKSIDILEKRNENLKERMTSYESNQSDWEVFKREFNHDMDELGKSLKDFTIDSKK